MYVAISTVPRLQPALLLRVHALCQAKGLCMDEFVNGVVEDVVWEAKERARERAGGGVRERRLNQELSASGSSRIGDPTGPFFVDAPAGITYPGGNTEGAV